MVSGTCLLCEEEIPVVRSRNGLTLHKECRKRYFKQFNMLQKKEATLRKLAKAPVLYVNQLEFYTMQQQRNELHKRTLEELHEDENSDNLLINSKFLINRFYELPQAFVNMNDPLLEDYPDEYIREDK